MNTPEEETLLAIEPDQFRRYDAVRSLVAATFEGPQSSAQAPRILDLGSGPERLTSLFLGSRYEIVRADIDTFGQADIVLLDEEGPLPFGDGSFDAVLAIEVLEHIEAHRRESFIREALRVGRVLALLTCPNGHAAVEDAEQRISLVFEHYNGKPHPFIHEHRMYGLPRESEMRATLNTIGLPYLVVDNSRLDRWEATLMLDQVLRTLPGWPDLTPTVARIANNESGAPGTGSIPYRKVYVVAHSSETIESVAQAVPTIETDDEPVDPVFQGALLAARSLVELDARSAGLAARTDRVEDELLGSRAEVARLETQARDARATAAITEARLAAAVSELDRRRANRDPRDLGIKAVRALAAHSHLVRRATSSRFGAAIRSRILPSESHLGTFDYETWRSGRLFHRATATADREDPGLLSLLTAAWNTPPNYLTELGESVLSQLDAPNYEWIVLDNGSTNQETVEAVQRLGREPRIRVFRQNEGLGIVGGLRYCLERAAGRYVLPVDHDDLLTRDCLRVVGDAIVRNNFPALLYTDEDKYREGHFGMPYLKPSWDPVLFANSCYVAHLGILDRELALELGAYTDKGAEGSPDWDAFTRFVIANHTPVHVPEVVYTWRMHGDSTALDIDSKPYVGNSQRRVLSRFIASRPHPERFTIESSPLFDRTPDWWIRRNHVDPRPILSLVLTTNGSKVGFRPMRSYPVHRVATLPISTPVQELIALLDSEVPPGALLHVMTSEVEMENEQWPWEALAILELHSDTVMVGGRVSDISQQIVAAGEYFGFGGACGCPDVGRATTDPGYFAQMWKRRSTSAVSTMLAVIEPDLVRMAHDRFNNEPMSLSFLGAWCGLAAAESGTRVVYSPFLSATTHLDRASWDVRTNAGEMLAFASRARRFLPDTRFLSPLLSLDPERPYVPSSESERRAFLQQALPSVFHLGQ